MADDSIDFFLSPLLLTDSLQTIVQLVKIVRFSWRFFVVFYVLTPCGLLPSERALYNPFFPLQEMANKYTLKTSITSHLEISISKIEKFLLHRLESRYMRGYNTHSFEAEDNINLIVRHDTYNCAFSKFQQIKMFSRTSRICSCLLLCNPLGLF